MSFTTEMGLLYFSIFDLEMFEKNREKAVKQTNFSKDVLLSGRNWKGYIRKIINTHLYYIVVFNVDGVVDAMCPTSAVAYSTWRRHYHGVRQRETLRMPRASSTRHSESRCRGDAGAKGGKKSSFPCLQSKCPGWADTDSAGCIYLSSYSDSSSYSAALWVGGGGTP